MAGYTRQSAADITSGEVIKAAPINAEYNAIRDAFVQASGHKHDGSTAEGAYVPLISDPNGRNKVVVDSVNNRISIYANVGGTAVEQLRIQDGVIVPVTDNDVDLGASGVEFKDLYLDGTAKVDTLTVDENATVAGTASVTGATTLGNTLGVTGATTLGDTVAITGATTLGSTVAVTGAATFSSTLSASGGVTANLTGDVTGDVTGDLTGDVTSSGTSTFNNITVTGTLSAASLSDYYLGAYATVDEPTTDNNGDPLETGDLYFNTTEGKLYVYNTTQWVAAAVKTNEVLQVANNLSDLNDAATALTNLGITATAAELNYVDGVTSSIQTQLDTKTSTGKAIAMAIVFGG